MDFEQVYNLESHNFVLISIQSDSVRPLIVQYIHSGNLNEFAFRENFKSFLEQHENVEVFQNLKAMEALTNETITDLAIDMLKLQDGFFYLLSRNVPLFNRIKSLKTKINRGSIEKYMQYIQCTGAQVDLLATYNVMSSQICLTGAEKALLKLTLDRNSEIDINELLQRDLTFSDFFQIALCCGSLNVINTCWVHEKNTEQIKFDLLNKCNEITAFHLGILTGKLAVVDWLLDQNFAIEAGDDNGDTGMHLAASLGHAALVPRLISRGASCNARNKDGKTPLHKAAEGGHAMIVTLLINSGAEIEAKNQSGNTPLIGAAENGHRPVVELLLSHGADICASNIKSNSCLHRAVFQGHVAVVELLLSVGKGNIEVQNSDGKTPLHIAAERGNIKVVELLIEMKANINSKNKFDQTPLHLAAWKGYKSIVELLLKCGAISKSADNKNRTALHEAASNGHDSVVKLLMESSDINADVDSNNDTALRLAKKYQKASIVDLLMRNGAK